MTRGRDSNHAYVVTEDNQTAIDVLTHAVTRDWIDLPAAIRRDQLGGNRDLADSGRSAEDDLVTLAKSTQEVDAIRQARGREPDSGMSIGL